MLDMIERSKLKYVEEVEKGSSSRSYFSAIKALSTKSVMQDWSLIHLFPDHTPVLVDKEAARFFSTNSNTFQPLPESRSHPTGQKRPLLTFEVARWLKAAKKPSSYVKGDVLPG